jgi:aspartyl-tRNA(Asn)/glutamyl-tRNA(Gln) amidotransferase subunit B
MTYIISGNTGEWEVVIGLEVHCQVISNSKLFSPSSTRFGTEPNSQVSLVDAAMPGMLPVINEYCVKQAVKTGLGLNAKINRKSVFARKNYFYADLPQGYQISQHTAPIVGEGYVNIQLKDGSEKKIGVERLHLEQDAAKSIHDKHGSKTYIDLNRCGIALMEIVSCPDMRSPEEAGEYLKKLRTIVRYLETCDGNMEEGSMRCDANVSVRKVGEEELRTRCEIKNVNSVRFAMQAIEYEANRQVEIYEDGGEIIQETRLFNSSTGETRSMRSKEEAHDYRYFPDPDLLPLEFDEEFVMDIRDNMPELPDEKKERFVKQYGITEYDASVLVSEKEIGDYYEEAVGKEKKRDGKIVANWMINELFARLNKEGISISESPVCAENLGKLVDLVQDKTISGKIAKDVFEIMIENDRDPIEIVEEKGLKQVTDTSAIEAMVDTVINNNPDMVSQYKGGKEQLLGWFTGQVMKESKGKANPKMVNEILAKKLSS